MLDSKLHRSTACSSAVSPLGIDGPLPLVEHPLPRAERPVRARGFAALDQDRRRQIASAGGKAAHERGNAHEFTSEEARNAGRKGGMSISQDRQHMASIGSKGGMIRGERQRERQSQPSAS